MFFEKWFLKKANKTKKVTHSCGRMSPDVYVQIHLFAMSLIIVGELDHVPLKGALVDDVMLGGVCLGNQLCWCGL